MGTRPNFVILPILSQFGNKRDDDLQAPFDFAGNISRDFPFTITGDLQIEPLTMHL